MERLLAATRRAETAHFWFRGLRRFARPLVARAVAGVEHPVILDCGCGTGANLRWLADFGLAAGFDRARRAERAARTGRVVRADVAAAPFLDGCADRSPRSMSWYSLAAPTEQLAVRGKCGGSSPRGMAVVNVAGARHAPRPSLDAESRGAPLRLAASAGVDGGGRLYGASPDIYRTPRSFLPWSFAGWHSASGRPMAPGAWRATSPFRPRRSTNCLPARSPSKPASCAGSICRSAARCSASLGKAARTSAARGGRS